MNYIDELFDAQETRRRARLGVSPETRELLAQTARARIDALVKMRAEEPGPTGLTSVPDRDTYRRAHRCWAEVLYLVSGPSAEERALKRLGWEPSAFAAPGEGHRPPVQRDPAWVWFFPAVKPRWQRGWAWIGVSGRRRYFLPFRGRDGTQDVTQLSRTDVLMPRLGGRFGFGGRGGRGA